MNLLLNLLINTLAVWISVYLLPGVHVDSFLTAFVVAVVLGALNAILRPLLIFFTLPLTLVTLGLFTFVINAAIVLLVDSLIAGFSVDSFWWALLFSLILTLIHSFLQSLRR
ncbi:phage holin family protein [Candidatus Roizmanbacteria bacterium]|nr:phage holin family protein [Candidatus Roizmanbacteria bacterium]